MATRLGLCSSLSFYRELTGSEITLGASGDCCPYADRIHWYVTLQCNQNHTDLTYLCCYIWIAPTQCIYYIFHKIYTQVLCFESVLFVLCKLRTQFLWKGRQYNSASFNCYEIVGRKCLTFFLVLYHVYNHMCRHWSEITRVTVQYIHPPLKKILGQGHGWGQRATSHCAVSKWFLLFHFI